MIAYISAAILILGSGPRVEAKPAPDTFKTGTLSNGLTYFVARSESAENIRFKLLVRVGNLNGLPEPQSAHILEHIVISKLTDVEARGSIWERAARLGGRANATTGAFTTSYIVDLPAANPSSILAGVSILRDWTSTTSPTDAEVRREHQAVIEEIRRDYAEDASTQRRRETVWFAGHPYLDAKPRQPGVLNATAGTIRRLHRDYYVPANMAVVVEGNVDPEAVATELSTSLGSLPGGTRKPIQLKERNANLKGGNFLALPSDETSVEITYKVPASALNSFHRRRDAAAALILETMSPQGFSNLAERDDGGVSGGRIRLSSVYSRLYGTEVIIARAEVKGSRIAEALSETGRLLSRLRIKGLTEAEVAFAKIKLLKDHSRGEAGDDRTSRWEQWFTDSRSAPSVDDIRTEIGRLTTTDVNRAIAGWLDPSHRDVFIFHAKTNASVPLSAEALHLLDTDNPHTISFLPPPIRRPDLKSGSSLPVVVPPPSLDATGVQRWRLPRSSATLLFRKTASETVRLTMARQGGESRFEDGFRSGARAASDIVNQSGLAGLNKIELDRFLAEAKMGIGTLASAETEEIHAFGPVGGWPEIVALAATRISDPQCTYKAFQNYMQVQREALELEGAVGDEEAFSRLIDERIGNKWRPNLEDLERFSLDTLCRQYRQMFGDTADMTITVEGNLSAEAAYRQVAGSLDLAADHPSLKKFRPPELTETSAGRTELRRGTRKLAKVALVIASPEQLSVPAKVVTAIRLRLFRRLREVEAGTYDPATVVETGVTGRGIIFKVSFECALPNLSRLSAAAKEEIDRFGSAGLTQSELDAEPSGGKLAGISAAFDSSDDSSLGGILKLFRSSKTHEFILLPRKEIEETASLVRSAHLDRFFSRSGPQGRTFEFQGP